MPDLEFWFFFILWWIGFLAFIIAITTRKKTVKITFTNKEEFLKKIEVLLFQTGYHLESKREDFITYKGSSIIGWRIAISFNQNEASIIGPANSLRYLMRLYNKKV